MPLQSLASADCIVIEGSNMAECHPVGFQWVMEAKAKGATVIHVDPRFTRTSAVADLHVPLRPGTDIAFLGGIINHVLANDLWFHEYVAAYTNAPYLVAEGFGDTEDLDGLFSGYLPDEDGYDQRSWAFAGTEADAQPHGRDDASSHQHGSHGADLHGTPERDPSMQDPRCVLQLLKRHYARYTPETVERICGVPEDLFAKVCEAWTSNSGRERTTSLVYSVGWTHHTVGVQYIRAGALLQLLLGNVGRPGGGVLALRGHASIQGSTDIPTLFNILPGYLPMPNAQAHGTLEQYLESVGGHSGAWASADAYTVSLLKSWFGDHATAENDYGFDLLPRINGDHGTYRTTLDMIDGTVYGYFLLGQNPAIGSAHGRAQRLAMANLDWLVVRDLYEIESASFWRDGPEIATGEISAETCATEVFLLPAASHVEKEGTFTQTQRLVQWREKAVDPPGDCRSDLWFTFHLGRRIREKLADSTDPRDLPLQVLTWDYPTSGPTAEPSAESVLGEINGYDLTTGAPLSTFKDMKADGSTAGGCWIYTGVYAEGVNHAARRPALADQDEEATGWAWAWPGNFRTLYNRASADPEGRPWSERKAYVWWDEAQQRWVGKDTPDCNPTKPPSYRAPEGASGDDAVNGDDAFVVQADGKGWLYVPHGLVDGPFPTHYEPAESPVDNALYGQRSNPTLIHYDRPDNPVQPSGSRPGSEVFPFVFTTARLTEHHTAGGMSRTLRSLSSLQPELFIEISPALAAERGLQHLGWCHLISARAAIEGRVMVTDRIRPLRIEGRTIHQLNIPYHWGTGGLTTGDSVNDLFGIVLDANVFIQESKVGACDVRAGRRPVGPALLEYVAAYRQRAGMA